MTSKPKAKKFRVRGQDSKATPTQTATTQAAQPQARPATAQRPQANAPAKKPGFALPVADEAGSTPTMKRRAKAPTQQAQPDQANKGNTIEAIRQEGLTGRQLRMARRSAQRNGLPATSDFDAVRLLRDAGIDPFQRANMLELVKPAEQGKQELAKINKVQLPQTVAEGQNLPAEQIEEDPSTRRAREIEKIQKEIVKRRQKKLFLLAARLAFFVGLPTLIAGWYFYTIATPLYSTKSSFLIQQNEEPAASGGGLFGAGVVDAVKDSIAVQGYLTSMGSMIRLNEDQDFIAHYSSPEIDSLSRLPADASNSEAFKVYKSSVKIGFDPTEGIINMEVIAPTPQASLDFSNALLRYAEEQVSDLTQRKREDQMKGARESFHEAEAARLAALQNLVSIQQELSVISGDGDVSMVMGQIQTLESELTPRRLALEEQLANRRPNRTKVEQLRAAIERMEAEVTRLRGELTDGTDDETSIASKTGRLRIAEADYETRDMMLQTALQALEGARLSADRQARYVAPSVAPVLPDAPSYPRSFENTLLAFFVFGGIYLVMSLTASILREQV